VRASCASPTRHATSATISALWHLFDLLAEGADGFRPKID
jgi:hypothetical protein